MKLEQIIDADFANILFNYNVKLDFEVYKLYIIAKDSNEAKRIEIELDDFIISNSLKVDRLNNTLILY